MTNHCRLISRQGVRQSFPAMKFFHLPLAAKAASIIAALACLSIGANVFCLHRLGGIERLNARPLRKGFGRALGGIALPIRRRNLARVWAGRRLLFRDHEPRLSADRRRAMSNHDLTGRRVLLDTFQALFE